MNYRYFYNEQGKLDSVNDANGATVYIPGHPRYTAQSNPLTAAFLATNPDLSDKPPTPQPPQPNWEALENQLRGTPVWAKAWFAASHSIAAQAGFTLLLITLTQTHNLQDLAFSVQQVRAAMQSEQGFEDFTEEELDFITTTLIDCGFDPAILAG